MARSPSAAPRGATRRRLLAMVVALAACGTRQSASPVAGSRLVSLTPAVTETLGALGALERLVGRSDWCAQPPEVEALPALGSALTPDLERIAALGPTAILVDASLGTRTDALGAVAPVEVLPWLTAAEVAQSTRRLGALVDRTQQAEALAARIEATLDRPPPAQGRPVLLALGGEGLDGGEVWYVRRNSLHGSALHAAGARNAVDRDVDGAAVLSLEALVALDPDTVIVLLPVPVDDTVRARVQRDWARMAPLAAVRSGRIGVVGGPLAMSTGPSILDLVDALRAELARLDAP